MAFRETVKTGILLAQTALKKPSQKKESQQNRGQAKKADLAVLELQEFREHLTPFCRGNEGQ
jgi:hypothetical protein